MADLHDDVTYEGWKRAKTCVLKLCVSHFFVYNYCLYYFCFVQWGEWECMNKQDLQLNVYDLISCSCWDAVVLHVGKQLFLGESNQRVDSLPLCTLSQGQN